MFEHEDIWRAIDRLAQQHGYSASGLAKKAGLDPTAFNKSKRTSKDGKPRWPSTESISKILGVTGGTMSEFLKLAETKSAKAAQPGGITIPLLGLTKAGREGYFNEFGLPTGLGWEQIPFPALPDKNGDEVYALEVSGDSMLPLYRPGDILVIKPDSLPRRGDRVIAKTRKGEIMAKEVQKISKDRVVLRSLNPEYEDYVLAPEDIAWIGRILWVSQ